MIAGMIAISRVIEPPQPRPQADVEEAFHHDLAGQRAGQRRVLPGAEQRDREQRARDARAEQRREQLVGVADVGDVLVAGAVERRRRHRRGSRALMKSANISATVESIVAKRIASRLLVARVAVLARLHDRRVQVQVVRHHRRAEDADRDVEHVRVRARSRRAARSPPATPTQVGLREPQLERERSRRSRGSARRPAPRRSGSRGAAGTGRPARRAP